MAGKAYKLTEVLQKRVHKRLRNGDTVTQIAATMGLSRDTILNFLRRQEAQTQAAAPSQQAVALCSAP